MIEVPAFDARHPEARAVLSRARDLLIAKFEPVEGSDILPIQFPHGVDGVLVTATNKGKPDFFDSTVDFDQVTAVLWVPGQETPRGDTSLSVTRHRVHTGDNIETRVTRTSSHGVTIQRGSGLMTATVDESYAVERHNLLTGERKKIVEPFVAQRPIRSPGELGSFLARAISTISVR